MITASFRAIGLTSPKTASVVDADPRAEADLNAAKRVVQLVDAPICHNAYRDAGGFASGRLRSSDRPAFRRRPHLRRKGQHVVLNKYLKFRI